jgi:hypothetical protein
MQVSTLVLDGPLETVTGTDRTLPAGELLFVKRTHLCHRSASEQNNKVYLLTCSIP